MRILQVIAVMGQGGAERMALQLATDALPFVNEARDRGLLVNRTDEKVIRMLPPLTISAAEIDRAVDILEEVFASVPQAVHA